MPSKEKQLTQIQCSKVQEVREKFIRSLENKLVRRLSMLQQA
jgi:hypothetical protein